MKTVGTEIAGGVGVVVGGIEHNLNRFHFQETENLDLIKGVRSIDPGCFEKKTAISSTWI
jgi:hypothetical protein